MKKIIALRIISLAVIALGMFLLIAGATSGIKPLKYNARITHTATKDEAVIYMEARSKGVFGPKEMDIKYIVYDKYELVIAEKVCTIKCGHSETQAELFYHSETKDVPYRLEVKIDSYKMNNTPPIVIGSILMAGAIALFVLLEIKQQKRLRTAEATASEATEE